MGLPWALTQPSKGSNLTDLFGSKGSFVQTFFPVPSVGTSIGVPTRVAIANDGYRGSLSG